MYLIYIDESGDEDLEVLSALAIPDHQWNTAFQQIRDFRRRLKHTDGIYVFVEFHAWKFVSGRGRISSQVIPKGRRCQIFRDMLQLTSQLPDVRLFNAVFPKGSLIRAFERLLNRIQRAMDKWATYCILICDRGKEIEYARRYRKMRVYNPIPSRFGVWKDTGTSTKNIPIDRILEDPFFKDSSHSYFIQIVDSCAYALLRKERPIPSKTKYGLDTAFDLLENICMKEASSKDPLGIIRP